jgi:hypothetical protein
MEFIVFTLVARDNKKTKWLSFNIAKKRRSLFQSLRWVLGANYALCKMVLKKGS